jgi:hypothetical protein
MKAWMKWVQERPEPFFARRMREQHASPEFNRVDPSRVALKVRGWIEMRPQNLRAHPMLAQDIARDIRETDTAVGRALAELGYIRRRGGRKDDPIRFHHRRVWTDSNL